MYNEIIKWILGVLTSTGIISFVLFLSRGTLISFLTKKIDHHFQRKLETFKSEIRGNEKELEQIRSFLVSVRKDRDQVLQAKRLEAAESMMHARNLLAEFSILVEYMKSLKTEELLKKGDDPKIIQFIELIIKPVNIDEKLSAYKSHDKTSFNLYISDDTLKLYEAYEVIMLHAATMMQLFSIPLRKKETLISRGKMSKVVIDLVPSSKDGFERYGDEYALHWSNYFYSEILKALRKELHGADNMDRDTEYATRIALDTRNAQLTIRSTLDTVGLSDTLLKPDINEI